MHNEELAERIQYFYNIAAKHGHQTVPASVAQRLFEEVVQPTQFGFSNIKKSLYGKQVSADIVHLLKFQTVKGGSYSLRWGVSLAYMPHKWHPQLEWHLTFKSARFDLFEEPFEYLNLQAVSWRDEEKYYAHGLHGEVFLHEGLVNLWNALQQTILAWFASAHSYEDIAEKARQQAVRKWIGPRHGPDPLLVYAFALAKSGKTGNAQEVLNSYLKQNAEASEAQNNLKQALLQVAAAQHGVQPTRPAAPVKR